MDDRNEWYRPLQGMLILIVDDEFLIAAAIEETFREAGAETISASTLSAALESAETALLTGAVLDVRLGRQTTQPIADVLTRRGISFFFYSGQVLPEAMRGRYPDVPVLMKPLPQSAFVDALLSVVRGA